jgi:hypothetical protein
MWKEPIFGLISDMLAGYFSEGTEEKHEIFHTEQYVCGLGVEPGTTGISLTGMRMCSVGCRSPKCRFLVDLYTLHVNRRR